MRKPETRLNRCEICGVQIQSPSWRKARTCSARCRKALSRRYDGPPLLKKQKELHSNWCLVCDKEFHSVRSDVKTCSPKCRKALSRSPAGHMARLRRLRRIAGRSAEVIDVDQSVPAWLLAPSSIGVEPPADSRFRTSPAIVPVARPRLPLQGR